MTSITAAGLDGEQGAEQELGDAPLRDVILGRSDQSQALASGQGVGPQGDFVNQDPSLSP